MPRAVAVVLVSNIKYHLRKYIYLNLSPGESVGTCKSKAKLDFTEGYWYGIYGIYISVKM